MMKHIGVKRLKEIPSRMLMQTKKLREVVVRIMVAKNALCPCGSGKKYKRCCINNSDESTHPIQEMVDLLPDAIRKANIKYCLHPEQMNCNGHIVKAHAIQNNRILNKLAVDGLVQTMDGVSNIFFQDAQCKGRKIATTFSGFCEYHDKTTFQDIEDYEFSETKKQIFLITYRTFAWHYHKKLQQIVREKYIMERMPAIPQGISEYMRQLSLCQRDNDHKMHFFNRCILDVCYTKITYSLWEIPYEIQFTVSTMLELEHDILGNPLNNLALEVSSESIYLNIFPSANKSFCIWSWPKSSDRFYLPFSEQFGELSIRDKENYLNNELPRWSDAIVISPRLWEKWEEGIQQALIAHANFEPLYRDLEENEIGYAYQYMDTPWNFFNRSSG